MSHEQTYHTEIEGQDVSFIISYSYSPGRPAVMYLRNGDPGYPADPPEIEVNSLHVIVKKDGVETYEAIPRWLEQIIIDSDNFFAYLYENHDEGERDYD